MAIFSRLISEMVKWRARRGPSGEEGTLADAKEKARRRGVRGETFAYWYLRRHGYDVCGAELHPTRCERRNNLVGYDGETLAFIEVRTRTARADQSALPELSVTAEKQHLVGRAARRFLTERHVKDCPVRFDVVTIDEERGRGRLIRLCKNAFSPVV